MSDEKIKANEVKAKLSPALREDVAKLMARTKAVGGENATAGLQADLPNLKPKNDAEFKVKGITP